MASRIGARILLGNMVIILTDLEREMSDALVWYGLQSSRVDRSIDRPSDVTRAFNAALYLRNPALQVSFGPLVSHELRNHK